MFIKFIKELSVKKILKNSLHNVKPTKLEHSIKSVGIIVDGSYFDFIDQLIQEFVNKGIQKEKIQVIVLISFALLCLAIGIYWYKKRKQKISEKSWKFLKRKSLPL